MKRRLFLQFISLGVTLGFVSPLYAKAIQRWIPTTVDELYEAMCAVLPATNDGGNIAWCPTSDAYEEFAVGTRVSETIGLTNGVAADARAEQRLCRWAWQTYTSQLRKLNGPATLYWRIKPEIAFFDDDWIPFRGFPLDQVISGRKARIYLRYVISSKPARYSEQELFEMNRRGELRHPDC